MVEPEQRLQQALADPTPVLRLRDLALALLGEGRTPADVLDLFEKARRRSREADRQEDEDTLLEAMDCLVGWCSPQLRVPGYTTTTEGRKAPE